MQHIVDVKDYLILECEKSLTLYLLSNKNVYKNEMKVHNFK